MSNIFSFVTDHNLTALLFPFLLTPLLTYAGANLIMANGQGVMESQKTWCVAKPSSDQATLLANLNYACSQVDCRILQKGCPCSYPDNLMNHASIAMNLYYQSRGKNHWNCDFRASGLVVVTDPSYGNCIYA
ncbi:Glucan endo-1,3-beta-glucosidase [Glycine soja]